MTRHDCKVEAVNGDSRQTVNYISVKSLNIYCGIVHKTELYSNYPILPKRSV